MSISRPSRWLLAPTIIAALALTAAPVQAQNLLISTGLGNYTSNQYGGFRWGSMSSYINGAMASVTAATTIGSTPFVLSYDRLWVDQRYQATLSAAEISTITAFIATGRRVVLVGENSFWDPFNTQYASIVGGTYGSACDGVFGTSAIAGILTAGVATVRTGCSGNMFGGTQVFSGTGVASLWGPNLNVLVWMDSNMQDDTYLASADNMEFAQNVATWLAGETAPEAVPEPATMTLLATGLAGVAALRRNRRKV